MTKEFFVEKSKEIFGDYYDYSMVDLKKKDEKGRICIICPEHGEFWQNPYSHLKGCGCYRCGKKKMSQTQSLSTEEFIEKARKLHNDKYDYSQIQYNGSHNKIKIICPEHGEFWQMAYSHLNGHGCPKCGERVVKKKITSDTETFIRKSKEIHHEDNDYQFVEYVNAKTPVKIVCKNGHTYFQTPNKHLNGHGCPYCKESKMELDIRNFLEENNIKYETEKTFDWLKNNRNMFLDFYLPDYNICIECQGIQHFKDVSFGEVISFAKENGIRDNLKRQLCEEHNIKVLYYANYHYDFPYKVYEDKNLLLNDILCIE